MLLGKRRAGLAELYRAAQEDPDLASNRRQLALLDALLWEAIEEYAAHGGVPWADLGAANEALDRARTGGDRGALATRLDALQTLIRRGASAGAAQDRIAQLIEQRRRVAESEQKREHTTRNMVTAAQAMALLMRVAESIRTNVGDPEARAAITRDISVLLGPGMLPVDVTQEQEQDGRRSDSGTDGSGL
jgi:hypothetical protein